MNDGESHPSESPPRKRWKGQSSASSQLRRPIKLTHDDYSIGWVCALHSELAMAQAMLDECHEILPNDSKDDNAYTLGAIHGHNIVIACLPSNGYGTNNAAVVASHMSRSFPCIRFQLVVGVGAGIPTQYDIRLGDVVVGDAVIQHDLGKTTSQGQHQLVGLPIKPPAEVQTAMAKLRAAHHTMQTGISSMIADIPDPHSEIGAKLDDWLFASNYPHSKPNQSCDLCDTSFLKRRLSRKSNEPRIHYGTIASGNQVIRDAQERDRLVSMITDKIKTLPPVLCFEMEAAGLKDSIPLVVIRGVCDYADSHKNKTWQPYAAAAAAAYAKQLLSHVPKRTRHLEARLDSGHQMKLLHDEAMAIRNARKADLHHSLRFDEIEARYENIELRDISSDGCRWLLSTSQFRNWQNSSELGLHGGFLWIKGKPGAGKSTMIKFLHDNAKQQSRHQDKIVLAFFFHSRGSELEKSTLGMYRSLCFQLFGQMPDLKDILLEVDTVPWSGTRVEAPGTAAKPEIPVWNRNLLQKILSESVSRLDGRHLSIFIDALDECNDEDAMDMIETFEYLGRHARKMNQELNICFSSRYYPNLSTDMGIELNLEEQIGHSNDIENYVHKKLGRLKASAARQRQIALQITQKASGVFLWVVLVIGILSKEIRHGRVLTLQQKIQELPATLSELFEQMVHRDNEEKESLLVSLQLILYSAEPLSLEGFYFAAISYLSPDSLVPWDDEDITLYDMKLFLVSCSKGLAETTGEITHRPKVQFIHQSVKDFLSRDQGLCRLFPDLDYSTLHSRGHDMLKLTCQNYLRWAPDEEALIDLGSETLERRFPFLFYSVSHILFHANEAAAMIPQRTFLQMFNTRKLWWLYFTLSLPTSSLTHTQFEEDVYDGEPSFPYILAACNYVNLLSTLLGTGLVTGLAEEDHRQPLIGAVLNEAESAVSLLLEYGAELEVEDNEERTALFLSVEQVALNIRDKLLKSGADINTTNSRGQTILMFGANMGDLSTTQWALENGAALEVTDEQGETALHIAAHEGSDEVVQLLLSNGADINAQTPGQETPLCIAIGQRNRTIIKLLLANGANPNAQSSTGKTALCTAIYQGNGEVVELLLESGANVDAKSSTGETALDIAINQRNRTIIKLLLTNGANAQTLTGETALHAAAYYGDTEIVKLLLRNGANVNAQFSTGETALHTSSYQKKEKIIALLISNGANIDARTPTGETALHIAARQGIGEVVKLLLSSGADIHARSSTGETSLHIAAERGIGEVVKLLLSSGADIHARSSTGETALHIAAERGRGEVVDLLLGRGATVHARSWTGMTPLHAAASSRDSSTVETLLNAGADARARLDNGQTPLHAMCWRRHQDSLWDATMMLLLLAKELDINAVCDEHGTALQIASMLGWDCAVFDLLKAGADINLSGGRFGNALQAACAEGRFFTASLLVTEGANINARGGEHGTALRAARNTGNDSIVRMLLEAGAKE